jgi:hypothetical protein
LFEARDCFADSRFDFANGIHLKNLLKREGIAVIDFAMFDFSKHTKMSLAEFDQIRIGHTVTYRATVHPLRQLPCTWVSFVNSSNFLNTS